MSTHLNKNTICLWYNNDAEDAALFYARTFPNSTVTAVHKAPADYPGGNAGDVLTVHFTVCGIACVGINGGDVFKHSEAFSFQIATDNQAETEIATGTSLSTMAAKKANAAGAGTNGAFRGKLRRVSSRMPWPRAAISPDGLLRL